MIRTRPRRGRRKCHAIARLSRPWPGHCSVGATLRRKPYGAGHGRRARPRRSLQSRTCPRPAKCPAPPSGCSLAWPWCWPRSPASPRGAGCSASASARRCARRARSSICWRSCWTCGAGRPTGTTACCGCSRRPARRPTPGTRASGTASRCGNASAATPARCAPNWSRWWRWPTSRCNRPARRMPGPGGCAACRASTPRGSSKVM